MTVDEIITELARAWNAGDSTGWGAIFAPDADFVDVLGRLHHGRDTTVREHRKIFDTIYRDSKLELQLTESHPIGANLVLMHTTTVLRVPAGPRAGETRATQTMLVRDGQIVASHNTIQADALPALA
jgi:uncharacterized protein (TIGR02246 family)